MKTIAGPLPEEPNAGSDLLEYLDYQEALRNIIIYQQKWIDKFQSAISEQTVEILKLRSELLKAQQNTDRGYHAPDNS